MGNNQFTRRAILGFGVDFTHDGPTWDCDLSNPSLQESTHNPSALSRQVPSLGQSTFAHGPGAHFPSKASHRWPGAHSVARAASRAPACPAVPALFFPELADDFLAEPCSLIIDSGFTSRHDIEALSNTFPTGQVTRQSSEELGDGEHTAVGWI